MLRFSCNEFHTKISKANEMRNYSRCDFFSEVFLVLRAQFLLFSEVLVRSIWRD